MNKVLQNAHQKVSEVGSKKFTLDIVGGNQTNLGF
jgi:hypothetical protein